MIEVAPNQFPFLLTVRDVCDLKATRLVSRDSLANKAVHRYISQEWKPQKLIAYAQRITLPLHDTSCFARSAERALRLKSLPKRSSERWKAEESARGTARRKLSSSATSSSVLCSSNVEKEWLAKAEAAAAWFNWKFTVMPARKRQLLRIKHEENRGKGKSSQSWQSRENTLK